MFYYIKEQARKQATNGVAVIEDKDVYQWAKNYFQKTNQELGINEPIAISKNKEEDKQDDEFGSIFDFEMKDTTEENKKEKIEQISIFRI